MFKLLSLSAVAAASLVGGSAQAHGYGRDNLPPPAYAGDGYSYSEGGQGKSKGFPLLGANAGVTVLGLHLGASGKLRIGLDEELQGRHKRHHRMVKRYAAPPVSAHGDEDEGRDSAPCCERGRY